jgi:protein ImuB
VDRLACVNVVALPLQLLLRAHPDWRELPVAVIDADKPQGLVLYVNARAREKGVRSGQRYSTALSITRELRAGIVQRSQINREVSVLTDRLRRFSPHVEPAADRPGVFWLDAQGLARLYPSLQGWAEELRDDLRRLSLTSTVAVGFSRFGSFAIAISSHAGTKVPAYDANGNEDVRRAGLQSRHVIVCADANDEHARVQRVPLACIDLDPDVRDRLLALGITTVGEFLRLPASGIRARFGAATDALYQLAAGARFSPLVPVPLEEPQTCSADIDFPESKVERLIFVVKRMLDGLTASIGRQVRMVAGLVLHLTLDNREQRTERVRPAAPTLDVAQRSFGCGSIRSSSRRASSHSRLRRKRARPAPASAPCLPRRHAATRTAPTWPSRDCEPNAESTVSCARACATHICPARGSCGSHWRRRRCARSRAWWRRGRSYVASLRARHPS